jgi:hypothetical protein
VLPLALLSAVAVAGCAAERPEDPVVTTGADLPRLRGVPPGDVVAFRFLDNAWQQVPVQVDERAQVDLGRVLNAAPNGVTSLTYADAGTFAGADPDPALDADDEVALMGIDSGVRAPAGDAPPGVVAGTGQELAITDALGNTTPSYAYLFRRSGGLDPGAGRSYVDYRFGLRSGDYKTTYKIAAGPNPEDSTVRTASYTRHFSDRWVSDGISVLAGGASGVDVLDRHKALFAPGNCVRSEDTFSAGRGAFVVNKSGPVRAIRGYIGANSGPYTQRTHVFYARREEIRTDLRVHAIPGVMDVVDFSPAASGMTYRSDRAPGGVKIDGVPDSPAAGELGWETANGPQGGLTTVHTHSTDIPGFASTSYYLDDSTPTGTGEQQCTGDAFAYGMSGPRITQAIPNTDPTLASPQRLTTFRHVFFEAPGKVDGPRRSAQVATPLKFTAAPAR